MSDIEITKHIVNLSEEQELEPANKLRLLNPKWVSVDIGKKAEEGNFVYYDVILEHRGKKVRSLKNEAVFIAQDAKNRQTYDSHFIDLKVGDTKEFMIDQHGVLVECAFEDYQNKLKTLPRRTAEKNQYIINAFETFLKDLRK